MPLVIMVYRTGLSDHIWPGSIISFVTVFIISVEIAIFGYPLLWFFDATPIYNIQSAFAFIMVELIPVSIITTFAYDIQKQKQ
jgi:hypothetical protein